MALLKRRKKATPRRRYRQSEMIGLLKEVYRPEFKFRLEATWFQTILYIHGLQNVRFSVDQARPFFVPRRSRRRANVPYNLLLQFAEDQKSSYLSRGFKWKVSALTDNPEDIQAARRASDVIDYYQQLNRREDLEELAASWLVSTGNAFVHVYWDPESGEDILVTDEKGRRVLTKTGDVKVVVDSPFRWIFPASAASVEEATEALRVTAMSRREAQKLAPKFDLDQIQNIEITDQHSFFEYSLLSFSVHHGFFTGALELEEPGEGFVQVFQYWRLPDEDYPDGLYVVAFGSGSGPKIVARVEKNPYPRLPVVHLGQIRVPGRLWFDAALIHAVNPQREINRRIEQLIENGNMIANPFLVVPEEVPDGKVTNRVGGILKIGPTAQFVPQYVRPPEMPTYVSQQIQRSMELLDVMLAPFGPSSSQPQKGTSSGIQVFLVQQQMSQKVRPRIRLWERGWQKAWEMVLDWYRMFATYPRRLAFPKEGSWREDYLRGDDVEGRIRFEVIEGTSMPKDRAAALAEWLELFKVLQVQLFADPKAMARFWQDIEYGDMVQTYQDRNLDAEKAQRNIAKAKRGEIVVPDDVDDPEIHIPIYEAVMKTEAWETDWTPEGKQALQSLLGMFRMRYARLLQARMAMAVPPEGGQEQQAGGGQGGISEGLFGGIQPRTAGVSPAGEMFQNNGGRTGGLAPGGF